jgi:hypothetical protein
MTCLTNDSVHRAAANDFPIQNRAARGNVRDDLLCTASVFGKIDFQVSFNAHLHQFASDWRPTARSVRTNTEPNVGDPLVRRIELASVVSQPRCQQIDLFAQLPFIGRELDETLEMVMHNSSNYHRQ